MIFWIDYFYWLCLVDFNIEFRTAKGGGEFYVKRPPTLQIVSQETEPS